jgi:hypothetical protein
MNVIHTPETSKFQKLETKDTSNLEFLKWASFVGLLVRRKLEHASYVWDPVNNSHREKI